MSTAPSLAPYRPLPIRLLNATGRALSAVGIELARLDAEGLLAAARRETGLDDFGDPSFRRGLDVLLESLEGEARLTALGRQMARAQIHGHLCQRLRLIDHRKQHPEVAQQEIRSPLFVVGLPRTGTSILHGLLAQDPTHRAPKEWEVEDPFPPPTEAQADSDPRIAAAEARDGQIEKIVPGFLAIHPMGARLPQECVAWMAAAFMSVQFEAAFHVPGYQDWLDAQDQGPAYRWHKLFLQHLQSGYARERWVLKTPGHLGAFDALFETYPDAVIVQTHRDPTEVLASVSSLECKLRGAGTDHIDPHATGAEQVRLWSRLLSRAMRWRDVNPEGDTRFFDAQFVDICNDPIAVVRAIYARFGWPVSDAFEERMARYLADNARDKHGTHRYALEDFGLDPAQTAEAFADYTARYVRKASA